MIGKPRRRWRWVTRDKGTEYENTVTIWPGARRPTNRKWNSLAWKWSGRAEDGVFNYQQGGPGESIDIDAKDFRRIHNCALQKGDRLKVEFGLKVLP